MTEVSMPSLPQPRVEKKVNTFIRRLVYEQDYDAAFIGGMKAYILFFQLG